MTAPLPFHDFAPTPPMGWNSWDCFATTVTEAQVRANAEIMAEAVEGLLRDRRCQGLGIRT